MGEAETRSDGGWAVSFESHQAEQFRRILESTPEERLAWLEEAIEFAHAVGALPGTPTPGGTRVRVRGEVSYQGSVRRVVAFLPRR